MIIRFSFILIIALISCISCKEKDEKTLTLEKMHDEVMYIHDLVMPEMSTIRKLKKNLQKKTKEDNTLIDVTKINQTIEELENGSESMMKWMEEFKKPDYSQYENAKAYYESEMDRIQNVKSLMETSILNANSIL